MLTGVTSNVYVTFLTGPLPPRNVTVGSVTVSQISVHWMLPGAELKVGCTFIVRCVDMSSRQERIVGMNNISKLSETSGLQSCTAVIGGLESYRKYRVEVFTITQHGIESCGQTPLTVQTGKCVTDLLHSRHFEPWQCNSDAAISGPWNWNSLYNCNMSKYLFLKKAYVSIYFLFIKFFMRKCLF